MKLTEAIRVAHEGKTTELQTQGFMRGYNWREDSGFVKYAEARRVISKRPLIQSVLKLIRYI